MKNVLKVGSFDINILKKMNKLKSNPFFQLLTGTKSLIISHSMKKEIYKKDDIIIEEVSEPDYYMVSSSKFKVSIVGKVIRI